MRAIFIFFLLLQTLLSQETELKRVSLQLLWLDQFQFAGYYMAKEKGFYEEEGFDVTFKTVDLKKDVIKEVQEGITDYGVGRANLIQYDSSGEKITLLSAIFQSSPHILLTLTSSEIDSIAAFKGKSLMQTVDLLQSASIAAMLKSKDLDISEINVVKHSFNLNDLVDGKVDIYSGYISNEPFTLQEMGVKYNSFSPQTEGLSFYSDILYTSAIKSRENPQEVRAFRDASLKGWEYAFSHISESVELILKKYNTQNKSRAALLYEATELKKLAYFNTKKVGQIDPEKLQRIYDIYKILGVVKNPLVTDKLLFHNKNMLFTKEEQDYLASKSSITYCTQPNTLPYSAIKNSKFIGIGAGILDLVHEYGGVHFELVETNTWEESLMKAVKRECDILPLASAAPSRMKYFNFTQPYYSEPLVIVTNKDENYILNVETILDKKFSVVQGNAFIEFLKLQYPDIKLVNVQSIQEGFAKIERGEVYGHIDIMMSSAYALQKFSKFNLRIAGQFKQEMKISFAVRNDDPVLFSIMNKLAKKITKEDTQLILNKWVSVNYTKGVNYWYFKEIGIALAIFLFFILYREYAINKKNIELQDLQEELVAVNKQLETRAYHAVQDLEKAQEIANVGSWILDVQEETLTWSKQSYKIFDIDEDSDDDLYNLFRKRIHPDDVEMSENAYVQSLHEQTRYSVRHRLVMDDGSIKYVNQKAETIFDAQGKPLVSYGTIQDVTSKVQQELEIKKKDAYMMHQSRLAQMGEMLSMIAHQWKQPLSAISSTQIMLKTTLELEKYDLADENEREDFLIFLDDRLDKIALYVQNLSQVIKDFSNFYKPNKEPEFLSIDSVILKSYELIKDTISSSNIEVTFDLNAEYFIDIYENELMQVILNLLNNAKDQLIDKEIQNPLIIVKSYKHIDEIVVEIEDNAGGISESIIDKVFDPYFSTKLEKNGTGLGLYMSKMIISEYHNGTISVHNSILGAVFSIRIKNSKK